MLAVDDGASVLGEFAIGTNYNVDRFTKQILFDEKIGGTFHMAVGAGYPETGSTNVSALHWDMVCDLRGGGEIHADGELIYRDGRFLPEFAPDLTPPEPVRRRRSALRAEQPGHPGHPRHERQVVDAQHVHAQVRRRRRPPPRCPRGSSSGSPSGSAVTSLCEQASSSG